MNVTPKRQRRTLKLYLRQCEMSGTLPLMRRAPAAAATKQEQTRQNNKKTKKFFYCRFTQIDLVKLNEAAPQWISVPEKQQQLKCPLLPI
jgi:hypothetical protein